MQKNIMEILIEHVNKTDAVVLVPIDRPTELRDIDFKKEIEFLVDRFELAIEYRGNNISTNYENGRYEGHPDWVRYETALWPGVVGVNYTQYLVYFSNEAAAQRFVNEINTHPEFGYRAKFPLEPDFLERISNVRKISRD